MTIITYVAGADDAVMWTDIFQLSAFLPIRNYKFRPSELATAQLPSAASSSVEEGEHFTAAADVITGHDFSLLQTG